MFQSVWQCYPWSECPNLELSENIMRLRIQQKLALKKPHKNFSEFHETFEKKLVEKTIFKSFRAIPLILTRIPLSSIFCMCSIVSDQFCGQKIHFRWTLLLEISCFGFDIDSSSNFNLFDQCFSRIFNALQHNVLVYQYMTSDFSSMSSLSSDEDALTGASYDWNNH